MGPVHLSFLDCRGAGVDPKWRILNLFQRLRLPPIWRMGFRSEQMGQPSLLSKRLIPKSLAWTLRLAPEIHGILIPQRLQA